MEDLVNISLNRYFSSLSKFGYRSYNEVGKLIILIFIQELLNSDCKPYITEDEYITLHKVLYCLCGSTCLIPYPEYKSGFSLSCSGKTNNN